MRDFDKVTRLKVYRVHISQKNAQILWRYTGLGGESGEFAEKFKKIIRDKKGKISKEDRELLLYELGDVAWHIAVLARELGSSFEEILAMNVKKLRGRARRNVIHGSGDKR